MRRGPPGLPAHLRMLLSFQRTAWTACSFRLLLNAMCWRDFRAVIKMPFPIWSAYTARINSSGLALAILPKRAKTDADEGQPGRRDREGSLNKWCCSRVRVSKKKASFLNGEKR
jgi:hypothetical protein